ncbi:MAG: 3D domain-containing protein [Pseudomonadota bacterium]
MSGQRALWPLALVITCSCATAGNTWLNEPLETHAWRDDDAAPAASSVSPTDADPRAALPQGVQARVIRDAVNTDDRFVTPSQGSALPPAVGGTLSGRVLGTYRNTYYDFPNEADFSGETVALKNGKCKTIKTVARSFYEAVCVQGSGTLASGSTVSFARRDCECAELCPRSNQHICFDELEAKAFPWGRGATGRAITPLLTIAVDSDLVPLDTPVYIPEFDGVPRDPSRTSVHDGCFIAQDRGVRVKGEHVDIFTGHHEITALWNSLVPSNRGVTIVLDSPRCARAAASP